MKNFILGFLLLLCGISYGQQITGQVLDEGGLPVPNAYITTDGGKVSTSADIDGNFSIKAAVGSPLTFSMLGYDTVTVNATSGPMKVTMKSSAANTLEEVVVIGYGTQKKADVTGAIAIVNEKDLRDRPNANVMSSVQGKVAGVNVVNSGTPGGTPMVNIRGIGSIAGSQPLYVVDGVLTQDISYLNPSDVESMSILKDASSSAIYGIRAANGVIIITTKKGKKSGKENIAITLDSNVGFTVPVNVLKLANAADYIRMYNDKAAYENNPATINAAQFGNVDTDWYKEILKKSAVTQNHNVSISGASQKTRYNMGLGYFTQDGILDAGQGINSGNDYKRITARLGAIYDITEAFRVGGNIAYSKANTNDSQIPFYQARVAPPVFRAKNADGTYGTLPDTPSLGTFANPRATLDFYRGKSVSNRNVANGFAELDIVEGLTAKTSYTRDNTDYFGYSYIPEYFVSSSQRSLNSSLTNTWTTTESILWENTLTYTLSIDKHRITALAGYSKQQDTWRTTSITATDVPYYGNDATLYLNLGNIAQTTANSDVNGSKTRFQSYFGRVQYAFADKYLLNATVRRDGASVFNFDGNQKSATFPSVGAGWVLTKEKFMEKSGIDFFKIKASWGRLGNASIARQYDASASGQNGAFFGTSTQAQTAISVSKLVDPSINWEIVTETDFGFESRFLKDRLSFEANYYNRETKDAVMEISIPSQAGLGNSFVTNAGSFVNKGFEFDVKWNDQVGEDFTYGVYANVTTIKNEVTEVLGGSFLNTGPGLFGNPIKRWEKGSEVGAYYGYQVVGVIKTQEEADAYGSPVGSLKFEDRDGNGIIDDKDKKFLGSPIPTATYGFGFNLGYKGVDLSVDFQGVAGNEIYNFNRNARYGNENWDQDYVNNHYSSTNLGGTYPAANSDQTSSRPSSFYVEKGDYFRIRNAMLGYTLPSEFLKTIKVDKIRFYVSAQNPVTWFKYNGFSPELGNQSVSDMGIDNNVYPVSAVYNFGVNVKF